MLSLISTLLGTSVLCTAPSLAPIQERGGADDVPPSPAVRVDGERLAAWHELVASVPHAAGTEGDERVIEALRGAFEGMGLETDVHRFTAYLSRPIDASLTLVSPREMELPVSEAPLEGSGFSEDVDPALRLGWNAYSGSGDVTAGVVYANYGRREDFERLGELGVDCSGAIVVARYGGNFRGYKAKYAEEAGAAGLLIYTDPKDSGFGKGVLSPEGGWATCDQIQRGSLKTLPYSGDPLTPGVEATADAPRLDPDVVALPRIPVQPIGWFAATQIMTHMRGESVPADWQGGMPFRYRLTGGDDLRVRLVVEQERGLVETANVVARLAPEGADPRDHGVIVGCHHDAWVYGANDPTSGLIALLEVARVISEHAQEAPGSPYVRPITFAAWGAEEHGIIGSSEWVEGREGALTDRASMYLNLDAAASGPKLGVAASPSLQALLQGAASVVPDPFGEPGTTALDNWRRGTTGEAPRVRFLGGGSDHVSFLARCAVPSASISAGGAPGTAYHSLYDDLVWYRRVVGPSYRSAELVGALTAEVVHRAAAAPVLPVDLAEPPRATMRALDDALEGRALDREQRELVEEIRALCAAQARRAADLEAALRPGEVVDATLRAIDRAWLDPAGLPGRPWYRNLYTAPDETSGYAAWPLPGVQKALLDGDSSLLTIELRRIENVLTRRESLLRSLASLGR